MNGHIAKNCRTNVQCNKCQSKDHLTKNCRPKCSKCNRFGHKTHECRVKNNQQQYNNQRQNSSRYEDEEEINQYLNEFMHL
jgi:hypothetical protein